MTTASTPATGCRAGIWLTGPAVILEDTATTIVGSDEDVRVNETGHLVITQRES